MGLTIEESKESAKTHGGTATGTSIVSRPFDKHRTELG